MKRLTTNSGLSQKLSDKTSLPSFEDTEGGLLDSLLGGDEDVIGLVT